MNLLKRISHYNLAALAKIAFFKLLRQIALSLEKHKPVKKYSRKPSLVPLNSTQEAFISNFWNKVPLPVVDSEIAEDLLRGKVVCFGQTCPLESYLQDPISNNLWPENEFFAEARTKIDGYGDVKYVLELNKLNHFVEAAKAYHYTKDIQYIHYIDKQLFRWKQEVPYEKSVANSIIMDVAFRSINLAFVSLLCMNNEYFRKQVYPCIHNILVLSERQMRCFSTPRWFKTGNGANHVIGEMVGLIVAQRWLAFIENKTSWTKPIKQEYKWLNEILEKLIAPSGAYLENSANYTRVVSEFLVCLQIFENALTEQDAKLKKCYLKLILGYLNDLQCNGNLPNFGDNDAATILLPFKKDFADITPLIDFYNINYSKNQNSTESLCKYLSDGQLIWNSRDKNKLHLFMRFGKWSVFKPGCASHLHADLMSVVLFVNGEPFFVDKGCLYYNQSTEVKRKALTTASHNTVFVEGHEQAALLDLTWYNYPQTIYEELTEPQIFRARITTTEGFSHTRSISYEFEELVIDDHIESPFEGETVKMQYLLHELVVVRIINNFSIELMLPTEKTIVIGFEGIEDLRIHKDTYYPHYGIERSTYAIRCTVPNGRAITHIKMKAI